MLFAIKKHANSAYDPPGFFFPSNQVLWKSQCWRSYTFSTPLACDATLERGDWGGKWTVREWLILIHKILPKRIESQVWRVKLGSKTAPQICLSLFNTKDVDSLGRFCFWQPLMMRCWINEKTQVQRRRHEWKNARTDELTHLFGAFGSVIKFEGALKPSWSIDMFITKQVASDFVGWRIFCNCLPMMIQKSTEFLTCKLLVVNMPQVYFIPNVVNWGSEPTKMTEHVQLD